MKKLFCIVALAVALCLAAADDRFAVSLEAPAVVRSGREFSVLVRVNDFYSPPRRHRVVLEVRHRGVLVQSHRVVTDPDGTVQVPLTLRAAGRSADFELWAGVTAVVGARADVKVVAGKSLLR